MQPSFSVSLRSLVTIASLIAIPAIAVVGVSAPRAMRSANRAYKPIVEPAASETAPAPESTESTEIVDETTTPPSPAAPRNVLPLPARKSPAFWNSDAPPVRPAPAEPAKLDDRATGGDSAPEGEIRQTAYEEHAGQAAASPKDTPLRLRPTGARLTNGRDASVEDNGPPATDAPDGFSVLERRLRELGATQYRLETWGEEGSLFRFRCLMAVPDRPAHNRYFEATDAEALRAMQRVLAQVERWRGRR